MEENQLLQETTLETAEASTPVDTDNIEASSDSEVNSQDSIEIVGQAEFSAPQSDMILGKFKTVEDLTKAYQELQKQQGKSSQEVGSLRKELSNFNGFKEISEMLNSYQNSITPVIMRDRELYNKPEYFQNETFKEMYSEGLMAYGDNLDTDRMVSLLETYVQDRIAIYEKQKAAKNENANIIDSMTYSKNLKNSLEKPQKSLSEMTREEFRESIRKLI